VPILHTKPSAQPPAAGYIRLDDEGDDVFAEHLKAIAVCCEREGVRLTRTFTDRGYDGTQLARGGLAELRSALVETEGLVVVVPTLDHLSPVEDIRSTLLLMIHRLDGRLVVAHEINQP